MKIFEVEVAQGTRISDVSVVNGTLDPASFSKEGYKVVPVGNKDAPYFCAAKINGTRGDANVVECNLLVFDMDSSRREELRVTKKLIEADGLEYVLYTTASHNPDVICPKTRLPMERWRLILVPEVPLTKEQYKVAIDYLSRKYRIKVDVGSVAVSQGMYFPSYKEGNEEHRRCVRKAGSPVALDADVLKLVDKGEKLSDQDFALAFPYPPGIPEAVFLQAVCDSMKVESTSRNEWLEVGRAIHHQTNGRGFETWNDWSSMDTRAIGGYDPATVTREWGDMKEARPGKPMTTMGALLNRDLGSGIRVRALVFGRLFEVVEDSSQLEKLRDYITKEMRMSDAEIAGPVLDGYKAAKKNIHGVSLSRAHALHELQTGNMSEEMQNWFHDRFVYIAATNQYFDLATRHSYNATAFDEKYSRSHGMKNPQGTYKEITRVLKIEDTYTGLRVVEGFLYRPQCAHVLIEEYDGYYLNTFDHSAWVKPDRPFDPLNDETDSLIELEMSTLFNVLGNKNPDHKKFLLQYLAHLRQKPGVRIKHAVCITSRAGGIGKSMMIELYRAVLGHKNVAMVTANVLEKSWDDYLARPVLMTFCDELDTAKSADAELMIKKLKTAITADTTEISERFKNSRESELSTSYAIFSNNPTILGDSIEDRRWTHIDVSEVQRMKNSTMADSSLEEMLGESREVFYGRLIELMRERPDRLAAFFDSYEIDDFSTVQGMKNHASISQASYRFFLERAIEEAVADNDTHIRSDIIQLTALVERASKDYRAAMGVTGVSGKKMRDEAHLVLFDNGFRPIEKRVRLRELGHDNPVRSGSYYFKVDSRDPGDCGETAVIDSYN